MKKTLGEISLLNRVLPDFRASHTIDSSEILPPYRYIFKELIQGICATLVFKISVLYLMGLGLPPLPPLPTLRSHILDSLVKVVQLILMERSKRC